MIDLTALFEAYSLSIPLTVTFNIAPALLIAFLLALARRKAGKFKPLITAGIIVVVTLAALNCGNILISHFENVDPGNLLLEYLGVPVMFFEASLIYPFESWTGAVASQFIVVLTHYLAGTLQTFILWAFVGLFSVFIGIPTLLIRLLVLERKLGGTFLERVKNVVFGRVPRNPLDEMPNVSLVKDYLVIGLVTLPAMVSFGATVENYYNMGVIGGFGLNVAIYIMLLYRFSYLTSSRLAKKGEMKCMGVNLGDKLMRSVTGPFTYFNILLSMAGVGNIIYGFYTQRTFYMMLQVLRENFIASLTAQNPMLGLAASALIPQMQGINIYMLARITLANTASIVFAVALLPLFENFGVHLYDKAYNAMVRFSEEVRKLGSGATVEGIITGVTLGAGTFIVIYVLMMAITGLALGGLYDPAVTSTLIYFALSHETYIMLSATLAVHNGFTLTFPPAMSATAPLAMWVLLTVFITMAAHFILGGASGSLATRDVKPEVIAFVSATITAVVMWMFSTLSTPLVGYVTTYLETPPVGVIALNRPLTTQPTYLIDPKVYINGMYIFRHATYLAYLVLFDLPIWILSTTLIAYLTYYAKPPEEAAVAVQVPAVEEIKAKEKEAAFKLTLSDVALSAGIFALGIVTTTVAAFLLYGALQLNAVWLFRAVIYEIAAPEGIEYWLYLNLTLIPHAIASMLRLPPWTLENNLPIILIHNFNRCILSSIGALIFWMVTVGFYMAIRGETSGVEWYILGAVAFIAEYFLFDDQFTPTAMIIIPLLVATAYKLAHRKASFTSTLIRTSLYSLCTLEILSTAFVIGGLYMTESVTFLWLGGKGGYPYLISILPHGVIEIPAAILATAIGISIAKRLTQTIGKPEEFLEKSKEILASTSMAATLLVTITLFTIAAIIEAYISPQIYWSTFPLLAILTG